MKSNKQSELVAKSITDILQTRLMDCTQNFKKLLQKRTEVKKNFERFYISF